MTRRPRRTRPRLSGVGSEPDYRFTLANERTFLAWIRTSLALVGGGVGVVSAVPAFGPHGTRGFLGLVLLSLASVLAVGSYRRWENAERALRLGAPLPMTSLTRILAGGVVALALAVAVVIVVMETS